MQYRYIVKVGGEILTEFILSEGPDYFTVGKEITSLNTDGTVYGVFKIKSIVLSRNIIYNITNMYEEEYIAEVQPI